MLGFVAYGGIVTWLTSYYKNKGQQLPGWLQEARAMHTQLDHAKDLVRGMANGGIPEKDQTDESEDEPIAAVIRELFQLKKRMEELTEEISTLQQYHV